MFRTIIAPQIKVFTARTLFPFYCFRLVRNAYSLAALITMFLASGSAYPAIETIAAQVTVGGAHSCVLTKSGGVKCWGNNVSGQLGNGTTSDKSIPVDVSGLSVGVTAIALGGSHSCALTSDGAVLCWGSNLQGQLGIGTTQTRLTPAAVRGLGGKVAKVAAGGNHTCALIESGALKCWGANFDGQVGDDTNINRYVPVEVSGLSSGVEDVAMGFNHTCALMTGGARCWGGNSSGQLGDGTKFPRWTPGDVLDLSSGVVAVTAGFGHTCALMGTGSVRCWGLNSFGELGDGTTTDRLTPVAVLTLEKGVSAIAAGSSHTCALANSTVWCWGANASGQMGNPSRTNALTPVELILKPNAISISAGGNTSCVLNEAAGVKCWGGGSSTPTDVSGLRIESNVISAGGGHTCSRMGTQVKCWGSNNAGQLGDGTTTDRLGPVAPSNLDEALLSVASGGSHTCAISGEGVVKCWGSNRNGQLGDGSGIDRSTPVNSAARDIVAAAISAGANHTCVLNTTEGVICWGSNRNGQLGDGTTNDRLTSSGAPIVLEGVIAIASGGSHSCALSGKGRVNCWGANGNGQLGDGTTDDSLTPIYIANPVDDIVAITAGSAHSCALTGRGTVNCWGANRNGQLGDGTTVDQLIPNEVPKLKSDVVAIAAGGSHTCLLTDQGAVKCWGSNSAGQIGDGTTTDRLSPMDVGDSTDVFVAIAAGDNHTCAVTKEGAIKCWGSNGFGQLGDGTRSNQFTPTAIPGLLQSIDFDSVASQIPYAETIVVNASANSGLPVLIESLTPATCAVFGTSLLTAIGQAGESCLIRAQQAGNGSFFPAVKEIHSFQIIPVTQTIIFHALPNRFIGNNEFEIRAEGGGSGFPVTFASQTPTKCATGGLNGTAVTLLAVGTCTIRASQSGDNNFTRADDVDQSFLITATSSDDSNTDWWRWRGGAGCTIQPGAEFDWSFSVILVLGLGLKLRRGTTETRNQT